MSDTTTPPILKTFAGKIGLPKFMAGAIQVLAPPGVRLSGAGIQFLSTVLITRQLGDEKSAGFFFWAALLTSFAPVATYGLEHLVLRNVPRLHDSGSDKDLKRYLKLIRSIVFALSVVIGLGIFGYALFRNEAGGGTAGFQLWHLLLPVGLSAMALTMINGEVLKGLSRPLAGVLFGHFIPVSLFCILIALNLDRLSSPFLVVIYAAAYVFALVAIRFSPSKLVHSQSVGIPDRTETSKTRKEGFPVFCTNTLGALGYVFPLMVLDFTRPAAEVAYVTTSFRISILFAILAAAIHGVFAPQLSRAAAIPGNAAGVWKVYRKTTGLTLLSLFIPFGIGIAFPELVMSVFGEQFKAGANTLQLLLISGLISLSLGPMLQLLLMTGNTQFLARLGAVKLLIVVGLSMLLVPNFGGIGMVISMGVAFTLEEVIGLIFVARRLKEQETSAPPES